MDEVLSIIIKVAGTIVGAVLVYLVKVASSYLKGKLKQADYDKLDNFVGSLVSAAEQLYKEEDPDGTMRLEYVQDMLIKAGYDLTDSLNALIESWVYAINVKDGQK